jgi:hypothetical protein
MKKSVFPTLVFFSALIAAAFTVSIVKGLNMNLPAAPLLPDQPEAATPRVDKKATSLGKVLNPSQPAISSSPPHSNLTPSAQPTESVVMRATVQAVLHARGTFLWIVPETSQVGGQMGLKEQEKDSFLFSPSWNVINATGSKDGWHLNIQATDFQGAAGNSIPVEECTIILPNADIARIEGNEKPKSLITTFAPLSSKPQKIVFALPGQGMGSYLLQPQLKLSLPANTPPGSYLATITLTIFEGP